MQVDPAELRFTQDSIGLYFKAPHDHFSIREAVRRLSRNEMSPGEFPHIRVISYGGYQWSVDNRRLWVFRISRCSSIPVRLMNKMHPRLQELRWNPQMCTMMEAASFLPRVRHRGQHDPTFDRLFLAPLGLDPSKRSRHQGATTPPLHDRGERRSDIEELLHSPERSRGHEISMSSKDSGDKDWVDGFLELYYFGQSINKGSPELSKAESDQHSPKLPCSLNLSGDPGAKKLPINLSDRGEILCQVSPDHAVQELPGSRNEGLTKLNFSDGGEISDDDCDNSSNHQFSEILRFSEQSTQHELTPALTSKSLPERRGAEEPPALDFDFPKLHTPNRSEVCEGSTSLPVNSSHSQLQVDWDYENRCFLSSFELTTSNSSDSKPPITIVLDLVADDDKSTSPQPAFNGTECVTDKLDEAIIGSTLHTHDQDEEQSEPFPAPPSPPVKKARAEGIVTSPGSSLASVQEHAKGEHVSDTPKLSKLRELSLGSLIWSSAAKATRKLKRNVVSFVRKRISYWSSCTEQLPE